MSLLEHLKLGIELLTDSLMPNRREKKTDFANMLDDILGTRMPVMLKSNAQRLLTGVSKIPLLCQGVQHVIQKKWEKENAEEKLSQIHYAETFFSRAGSVAADSAERSRFHEANKRFLKIYEMCGCPRFRDKFNSDFLDMRSDEEDRACFFAGEELPATIYIPKHRVSEIMAELAHAWSHHNVEPMYQRGRLERKLYGAMRGADESYEITHMQEFEDHQVVEPVLWCALHGSVSLKNMNYEIYRRFNILGKLKDAGVKRLKDDIGGQIIHDISVLSDVNGIIKMPTKNGEISQKNEHGQLFQIKIKKYAETSNETLVVREMDKALKEQRTVADLMLNINKKMEEYPENNRIVYNDCIKLSPRGIGRS